MNPISIARSSNFISNENAPTDLLDIMLEQIRAEKFMEFHQSMNKFSRENDDINSHQLNKLLEIRNLLHPFQNIVTPKLIYILNSVALIEVVLFTKNVRFKTQLTMSQILTIFAIDFNTSFLEKNSKDTESHRKGLFSKHLMMMLYEINSDDSSLSNFEPGCGINWKNLLNESRQIACEVAEQDSYLFEIYFLCLLIKVEAVTSKTFQHSLEVASIIHVNQSCTRASDHCLLHLTDNSLTQFIHYVFDTQILNPVENVSTFHRCKILDAFHVIETLRKLMLNHMLSIKELDKELHNRYNLIKKATIIEYDYLLALLIGVRIQVMLAAQFEDENKLLMILAYCDLMKPHDYSKFIDYYNQHIEWTSECNHEEPLIELMAVQPSLFLMSNFLQIVNNHTDRTVFSCPVLRDYFMFCMDKSTNVFECYNYLIFFLVTSAVSKKTNIIDEMGEEERSYFDLVISVDAPNNFFTFKEYDENHRAFNVALQAVIQARQFLSDQDFGKILCSLFQKWPTVFNYHLLIDLYLKNDTLSESDMQILIEIVKSISEKNGALSYFACYIVSTALDNTPSHVLKTTLFPEEISVDSMKAKLQLFSKEIRDKLKREEDQSAILEYFSSFVYILQFLKPSPMIRTIDLLNEMLKESANDLLIELFLADAHTNIKLDFNQHIMLTLFIPSLEKHTISLDLKLHLYDLQYIQAYQHFLQSHAMIEKLDFLNRKYFFRPSRLPRQGVLTSRLRESLKVLNQEGLLAIEHLSGDQFKTLLELIRESYVAGVHCSSNEISCLIKIIYCHLKSDWQMTTLTRLGIVIQNLKNLHKYYGIDISVTQMMNPIESLINCLKEFLSSKKIPKREVLNEIQRSLRKLNIICKEKQLLIKKLDSKMFGEVAASPNVSIQPVCILPQHSIKTKRIRSISTSQQKNDPVATTSAVFHSKVLIEESLNQLYERLNIASGDELIRTLENILKKLSTEDYESFSKYLAIHKENSLSALKVILKVIESWNVEDRDLLLYHIILTNRCFNTRMRAHKSMKTSLAQDLEICNKMLSVDSEATLPRKKQEKNFLTCTHTFKQDHEIGIRVGNGDINKYGKEIDWSEIKLTYDCIIKSLIDKAKQFGFTFFQKDDKSHAKWGLIDNDGKDYGSIIIASHGHHLDKINAQIRYKEAYAFICIARDKLLFGVR